MYKRKLCICTKYSLIISVASLSPPSPPFQVPQAELRYIVGSYLENGNKSEAQVTLQNAGYKIWVFPKCSNAVMTEFPNRSMLSIILAPNCVYPALEKYFEVSVTHHFGLLF